MLQARLDFCNAHMFRRACRDADNRFGHACGVVCGNNYAVCARTLRKKVLDKESVEGRHQGVIAFTTDYEYSTLDEIISAKKENGLIVLCDGVEDVHNLGSIIRVAECAASFLLNNSSILP